MTRHLMKRLFKSEHKLAPAHVKIILFETNKVRDKGFVAKLTSDKNFVAKLVNIFQQFTQCFAIVGKM